MKLLLLADSNSSHTIKWASALIKSGIDVLLFSVTQGPEVLSVNNNSELIPNDLFINQHVADKKPAKIKYLFSINLLRKVIAKYKPDILHAHYATSYGLLGALSGFHPLIISAWGTDILKFPEKSFLHRKLLKFNLNRADKVLATSNYLAASVKKYYKGSVDVTPFGVDTSVFKPWPRKQITDKRDIIIGTVKTMEDVYGIDNLIRAFKIVREDNPDKKLNLLLVGGGSQIGRYKSLTAALNIYEDVIFTGYVEHERVTEYHNMMDIEVFLSRYESFGVSVLEASACEKPVIVSGVGGLLEVVDKDSTGLIVSPDNIEETAAAMNRLVKDENLRYCFGRNGRQKVLQQFSWDNSVENMIKIYNEIIS